MTCKDCLHYDVCQYRCGRGVLPTGYQCKDFTDRSEWMHLLCKVNTVVYVILYNWESYKDYIAKYQITSITITQNKKGVWTKKYRAMKMVNGKTINSQINFGFHEINEDVFLTYEEAEKALEKIKKIRGRLNESKSKN